MGTGCQSFKELCLCASGAILRVVYLFLAQHFSSVLNRYCFTRNLTDIKETFFFLNF